MWKTLIYNHEIYDKFEISNNGQLRNINTGTIYKQVINKNGYNQVCVSLGSRNNKKVFKIHKAVAETFIPNINDKPEVNHKDGNKQNNNVSNLEWVTSSENIKHAYQTGLANQLRGTDSPCSKLTYEDVVYIRENYIPRDTKYGTRGLGRKFNVDHETIRDVIYGNTYQNINI